MDRLHFVERLTGTEKRQVAIVRDKWRAIGRTCGPVDLRRVEQAAVRCYRAAGLKPPSQMLLAGDPTEGVRLGRKAGAEGRIVDRPAVGGLGSSSDITWFYSYVGKKVEGYVDREFADIDDGLINRLIHLIYPHPAYAISVSVWRRTWGFGHEYRRRARDDCFVTVLGVPCPDGVAAQVELAQCCAGWLPLKDAVIIQPWPSELHENASGLHCDVGPAMVFPNGFRVWALNGVLMPQRFVETPAEDLDPLELTMLPNTGVRREFVRKLGIERLCRALKAKSVDKQGDYELLLLDVGRASECPYLKMRNPSTGTWHVEGVHPDCRTVAEALAWRSGSDEAPEVLT